MRIIFLPLILFSLMLLSCSTPHAVAERYSGVIRTNPNIFRFFADSTFSYEYWGVGHYYKHSSGTYKIDGNRLILSSKIQNRLFSVDISTEQISEPENKIEVFLITKEGWKPEDYRCSSIINGELIPSQANGNYHLSVREPIKTISFIIWKRPQEFYLYKLPKYPFRTEQKNITESLGNLIKVYIYVDDGVENSLFNYRVFTNKVLRLRSNCIIFRDEEERNYRNILHPNENNAN